MSAKVEIDWKVLDALLQFKVTCKFCAEYMDVSKDAIERRIKEKHNLTFKQYHMKKMARTAVKLQQKAIETALTGNTTMMIFALKNIAGWADKIDESITGEIKINIDGDDAKL